MLAAVWTAALQSRGEMYAKQFCLNQPGGKGKTPLMLACKNGCAAAAPRRPVAAAPSGPLAYQLLFG